MMSQQSRHTHPLSLAETPLQPRAALYFRFVCCRGSSVVCAGLRSRVLCVILLCVTKIQVISMEVVTS